jgi:hypothetical protein
MMKLTFIYQPIEDLREAVAFHRDQLGFDEAWREGDDTVEKFEIPGGSVAGFAAPGGNTFYVFDQPD